MAHPTEHIPVAVLKEAHRNGIRVFLVATALQLLIYALTMTTIVVRAYLQLRDEELGLSANDPAILHDPWMRHYTSEEFLERFLDFLPSLAIGGLTYLLVSAAMGRWAGERLSIQGNRFGRVGLAFPVLPSFCAANITQISMIMLADDGRLTNWEDGFTHPILMFMGFYALPGMVVGVIAAYVAWQRFRGWLQLNTDKPVESK